MHHFEITMGETCAEAVVKMDGKVVTGLKSFSVDCGVHDVPRITLELEIAETSLLSGRAQVWVRDKTDELVERAEVAEARAEACESEHGHPPPGSTLAYIVPVDPTKLDGLVKPGDKP